MQALNKTVVLSEATNYRSAKKTDDGTTIVPHYEISTETGFKCYLCELSTICQATQLHELEVQLSLTRRAQHHLRDRNATL